MEQSKQQRRLHFETALLPEGWARQVTVNVDTGGVIAEVVAGREPNGAERVPGVALPGVPNVHSHAHQRAMAGLAERAGEGPDSFWTWREVMYGFLRRMGPEDLEAVAAQLYLEMLKAGFTAVGEFQYLHHAPGGSPYENPAEMTLRCLRAAESVGIGMTALPVLYAHGDFGGRDPSPGQARFLCSAEAFLELVETLRRAVEGDPERALGIAPHSLRAVTPELMAEVLAGLGGEAGTMPIHIHVAEQVREVEDCLTWCGARPVEWLLESLPVTERWCAVHATYMLPAEGARLAGSGAVAGLCPTTEANLGDGIFPAVSYLAGGGAVSIGSDSQITVDPAEDLRLLEYSQRLRDRARNVLAAGPGSSTGRSLLERVLAGGGRALGRPIGRIAPGARADFLLLDPEHPSLLGRTGDALLDSWIFSAGRSAVRNVIVGGRWLVRDGRHPREEEVLVGFRAALERLGG